MEGSHDVAWSNDASTRKDEQTIQHALSQTAVPFFAKVRTLQKTSKDYIIQTQTFHVSEACGLLLSSATRKGTFDLPVATSAVVKVAEQFHWIEKSRLQVPNNTKNREISEAYHINLLKGS